MPGRKLTVDWKHTADEFHARYQHEPNCVGVGRRVGVVFLPA